MAAMTPNKPLNYPEITISKVDANAGPHTFTYSNYHQVLYIANSEAVPLTVNVKGDGVLTYNCPEYGSLDVSGGLDLTVLAGATITLYTRHREAYMGANGNEVTVTVTGSTAPDLAFMWIVEQ